MSGLMRRGAATLLVAIVMSACGGSPTAPAPPTTPPPAPTPAPAPAARFALSGRITASGGAPVVGALVEIVSGADTGERRTSDGDGRYAFDALQAGALTLRVSADGLVTLTSAITISADQVVDLNLVSASQPPPARVSLSGTVCPADGGRCLPGATVAVTSGTNTGRSVTTDDAGHYSLSDLAPGDLTIAVSAPGFVQQSRSLRLSGDEMTDFALAAEPFVVVGRAVDAVTQEGVGGVAVSGDGLTGGTTDGSGAFRLSVPVSQADPRLVVLAGPGVVERRTHLRIPGMEVLVSLISSTFDMPAFDEMFRSPMLRRWTTAPPLRIERRVVAFTDVNMPDAQALDDELSEPETEGLIADLTWALPQLTGDRFSQFDGVTRQTTAPGSRVALLQPGVILVCRVEGLTAATTFWGYGRWLSMPDGTITGGLVMIDRAFDESGSPFRRSLRAHELGHALGYQHVAARISVMNPAAREEPNPFDRAASRIAFDRQPGNRSPDVDPDIWSLNRLGPATWSRAVR